jgi:hypothetical protein
MTERMIIPYHDLIAFSRYDTVVEILRHTNDMFCQIYPEKIPVEGKG